MADEDRQWRRSIEQQVARARTGGLAAPHTHDEYLTFAEGDAAFLTKAEADAFYAALGAVGGMSQVVADLRYSPLLHSHAGYATAAQLPVPSDGTPRTITTGNPGTGTAYARWDHVHGNTGLAVDTHAHSGTYDPAGTAAAGDTAHVNATNPHAAYALAAHTHPASGVVVQKATADQAFTAVTLADATNMGFAVAANGNYEFEYLLAITSAALTTGWQFGFTGPASPTMFVAVCEHQSAATAWTVATLTALGSFPLVTAAYAAAPTPIVVRIKGVIANGANAGTVQLRGATEVAASAVTLKRGSTLMVA